MGRPHKDKGSARAPRMGPRLEEEEEEEEEEAPPKDKASKVDQESGWMRYKTSDMMVKVLTPIPAARFPVFFGLAPEAAERSLEGSPEEGPVVAEEEEAAESFAADAVEAFEEASEAAAAEVSLPLTASLEAAAEGPSAEAEAEAEEEAAIAASCFLAACSWEAARIKHIHTNKNNERSPASTFLSLVAVAYQQMLYFLECSFDHLFGPTDGDCTRFRVNVDDGLAILFPDTGDGDASLPDYSAHSTLGDVQQNVGRALFALRS